jgi:uncharacterized membrane protein (UPF0127 family)
MKKQGTIKSQGRKKHIPYSTILSVLLAIIAAVFLYRNNLHVKENVLDTKVLPESATSPNEQQFVKEGELQFLHKTGRKGITKIDIEIADNDYEREKGLMYRHSLPDSAGMLFIFDRPKVLSFWMRNTYIPLDIIFADEDKQIVKIQKNAEPLFYGLISSHKTAKYVVEVNGGFSDRFGIVVGDHIVFNEEERQTINASRGH